MGESEHQERSDEVFAVGQPKGDIAGPHGDIDAKLAGKQFDGLQGNPACFVVGAHGHRQGVTLQIITVGSSRWTATCLFLNARIVL